ncbi:helix-turn-helix domain-containing protein [Streptomyces sp. NPDC008222]|uniref:AraC family transcriptional regulator n=1 Tax=Streptomyces sp. NPDC008222 TaxID=3364820 RepID=UPI0036E07944
MADLRGLAYDQLPIALGFYDENIRLVGANAAGERSQGRTKQEMRGLRLTDFYDSAESRQIEQAMEQTLLTGRQVTVETFAQTPGESLPHAWTVVLYPLKDQSERVQGVAMAAMDTTVQFLARRRLANVNAAGARIGTTLDTEQTVQTLADFATEQFADYASVDLLTGAGHIELDGRCVHLGASGAGRAGSITSRTLTGALSIPARLSGSLGPHAWGDEHAAVRKAIAIMQDRLAETLTLADIAAEVHLSVYHFLRVFRLATGETPYRYLTRLRIALAQRLLSGTTLTMQQIAERCGFSGPGPLSAAFLRQLGIRPSVYRRNSASNR